MNKKPVAYIDADILLHRAVSFCDDEWDGEKANDWKQALHYFNSLLDSWLKQVGKWEDYFLVLSVGRNFRKDLYPEYKANRKDIVPHASLFDLKDAVMEYDAAVWEEGIEADDLIGIRCSEDVENTLAVSADKDFATVPCNLMIPRSHGRTKPIWEEFTEAEANRNWMIQSMTGDTIDNYPGIPGYGPKKAADVVDNPRTREKVIDLYKRGPKKGQEKEPYWIDGKPTTLWNAMVSHAASKGMSEADLLINAQLARILRDGDYDFETKEVNLWNPH